MRNVPKLTPPNILIESKINWDIAVTANPTDHNKNKYRHTDIKQRLLEETNSKCVYCESKIGHNCPGDIEHKVPKSKRIDLIFNWDNLTIACTECNRRKREYYDPNCMFLDPNNDDVESRIQHVGPLIFNKPGDVGSELTVRMLEIDKIEARKALIARKIELLEHIKNLIERIVREKNQILKQFLMSELLESCSVSSEFSGMVKTYINTFPDGWLE
jgi:uncharacterized protein (TIGR02646 family)